MITLPLTDVETIVLPAVERFIATERVRFPNPDGVIIATATSAFIEHFLFCGGQREFDVPKARMVWSRLPEAVRPGWRKPTAFAHFWELLRQQPEGQSGPLETDGISYNRFHIKSSFKEVQQIVLVHFSRSGGWVLDSPHSLSPAVERRTKFFWTLKALSS